MYVLPELLTRKEAQDVLKVGTCTMYKLIRNKEIPTVKVCSEYRIRRDDLIAYLERQK